MFADFLNGVLDKFFARRKFAEDVILDFTTGKGIPNIIVDGVSSAFRKKNCRSGIDVTAENLEMAWAWVGDVGEVNCG